MNQGLSLNGNGQITHKNRKEQYKAYTNEGALINIQFNRRDYHKRKKRKKEEH